MLSTKELVVHEIKYVNDASEVCNVHEFVKGGKRCQSMRESMTKLAAMLADSSVVCVG